MRGGHRGRPTWEGNGTMKGYSRIKVTTSNGQSWLICQGSGSKYHLLKTDGVKGQTVCGGQRTMGAGVVFVPIQGSHEATAQFVSDNLCKRCYQSIELAIERGYTITMELLDGEGDPTPDPQRTLTCDDCTTTCTCKTVHGDLCTGHSSLNDTPAKSCDTCHYSQDNVAKAGGTCQDFCTDGDMWMPKAREKYQDANQVAADVAALVQAIDPNWAKVIEGPNASTTIFGEGPFTADAIVDLEGVEEDSVMNLAAHIVTAAEIQGFFFEPISVYTIGIYDQRDKTELCTRCGKKVQSHKAKWLELDQTTGLYLGLDEALPEGHDSQGGFPFGSECVGKANQPFPCSYCSEPATHVGAGTDGDFYCDDHKGKAPGSVTRLNEGGR